MDMGEFRFFFLLCLRIFTIEMCLYGCDFGNLF